MAVLTGGRTRNFVYGVLERPKVYNLVQRLAAVGGMHQVRDLFAELVDCQEYDAVLELGCGTGAWSVSRFNRFVRTDINERYFPSLAPRGVEFRTADAENLSDFGHGTFDLVYSFGLYHHLPDTAVVSSLKESLRVLRRGGGGSSCSTQSCRQALTTCRPGYCESSTAGNGCAGEIARRH